MRVYSSLNEVPATCVALPIANILPQAAETQAAADCLVIDATNVGLEKGALFIVRYSVGSDDPQMALVEAIEHERHRGPTWWSLRRPGHFFVDGPFSDPDNCEYLRSRIVGRVVGYLCMNADPAELARAHANFVKSYGQTGRPQLRLAHTAPRETIVAL
jgi:hypothetical protein